MQPSPRGFTLVEMLTSAAILSIAVVALVAVVRTGRELEITDLHRRRARTIIDSCFEDSVYHPDNYDALTPAVFLAGSVLIDPRDAAGTGDDLMGGLWFDIAASSTHVAHKRIRASVHWREPEGIDSIWMEKWVADVQ